MSASPVPTRVCTHLQRVFYGDTDQMGVAYYANYLRWFEMGRNEYLREVGYPYARLESEGVVLPVTEVGCRYVEPARYDDLVEVQAWIASITRVRVRFEYRIARHGDGAELALGFTVHACLSRDGGVTRLPGSLLDALGDSGSGSAAPRRLPGVPPGASN